MTYAGQVHGSDLVVSYYDSAGFDGLNISSQPFMDGLSLFEQALDTWLPCFKETVTTSGGALGTFLDNVGISALSNFDYLRSTCFGAASHFIVYLLRDYDLTCVLALSNYLPASMIPPRSLPIQ